MYYMYMAVYIQDQIAKLHWHANEKVAMQSWHARKNQLASQCRCVRQRCGLNLYYIKQYNRQNRCGESHSKSDTE